MRILVVEDELKTSNFLRHGLTENGFVVDIANNGEDGYHLAQTGTYDLVILDIMLPKIDGWTVLKRLRGNGIKTNILFLTAKGSTEEKVVGLNLGADDYIVKPFSFSELLARVRTLLRRSPLRETNVIRIADLEIDSVQHKAIRDSKRLELTPKEFLLLSLLARRAGEVLSRTIIAEKVWDMSYDSDTNVVETHMRRLRAKVDDPFDKKLIHTVRGMGYVLEERSGK